MSKSSAPLQQTKHHSRWHWQQSLPKRIIISYGVLFLLVLTLLVAQLGVVVYRSLISLAENELEVKNFLAANAFEDPRSDFASDFAISQQWHDERQHTEDDDHDEDHPSQSNPQVSADPIAFAPQVVSERLQRSAVLLASQTNARVTILTAQGNVAADSNFDPGSIPNQLSQIEVESAINGREQHSIRIDPQTGARTLFTAAVIHQDGHVLGIVRLAQSMQLVLAPVRRLLGELAVTGVLALLLVTAVGIWNGRRMLKPVEELKEAAVAIAQGDLQRLAPVSTDDEIGALAMAFNQMVTNLRTMIEQQRLFVANASHELRTPIFNIKLRSEAMLSMDESEKEQSERFLNEIDSEANRLGRMANSLLDLARLESSHETAESGLDPIDLAPILLLVAQSMRMRIRKAGLAFMARIPEQLPLTYVDSADIETLVLNLLDNAIKYTPSGGVIQLLVDGDAQQCTIAVNDNGPGIPAEDIPFIFDRFYRVDKSRSRRKAQDGMGSGSGLGLSIVKAIVARNHGQIDVSSQIDGGATFTVTFPVYKQVEINSDIFDRKETIANGSN